MHSIVEAQYFAPHLRIGVSVSVRDWRSFTNVCRDVRFCVSYPLTYCEIHYKARDTKSCVSTENGLIIGKDALRSWWQDSFDRLPSLRYEPTRFIADDDRIFMEYTRYVDGEDSMTVGEVLEIKGGLIALSRVYHS